MALPARVFTKTEGRLAITALVLLAGNDAQIVLYGGKAHIGAVASAYHNRTPTLFTRENHREADIALKMASVLAAATNCCVSVSAGIHYDHISPEEIHIIENICGLLTEDIRSFLTRGTT